MTNCFKTVFYHHKLKPCYLVKLAESEKPNFNQFTKLNLLIRNNYEDNFYYKFDEKVRVKCSPVLNTSR